MGNTSSVPVTRTLERLLEPTWKPSSGRGAGLGRWAGVTGGRAPKDWVLGTRLWDISVQG